MYFVGNQFYRILILTSLNPRKHASNMVAGMI